MNGKPFETRLDKQTFAAIRRRWSSGDMVHVRLPLSFRTEAIDDKHPSMVAVMRGPVMLVAIDPPADLNTAALALSAGLAKSPEAGAFEYTDRSRSIRLKPFYSVTDEIYTTYFMKRA